MPATSAAAVAELPAELIEHLRERLAVEFAERDFAFKIELGRMPANFAARGMLGSGAFCHAVVDRGRIELKTRNQLLLSHFARSSAVFGVTYESGIGSAANGLVQELLAAQRQHLHDLVEESAKKSGVFTPNFFASYDEAAKREAQRARSELQLWELQLKQRRESEARGSQVVNVSGSFNIVQAGTIGSTASIVVDADSREALTQALAALREAIPQAHELSPVQIAELAQVVNDCERELSEETLNRTRLFGYLQALATTVQTTASLQPAWEVMRRALQMMGLSV